MARTNTQTIKSARAVPADEFDGGLTCITVTSAPALS